jgi:hypothetical protein
MTPKESGYRGTLKYFGKKYGLTEEKFLYLYYLRGEEREKEYAKLPRNLRYEIVHLQAAYCGYLREKEKQEKKNND